MSERTVLQGGGGRQLHGLRTPRFWLGCPLHSYTLTLGGVVLALLHSNELALAWSGWV